MRESILINLQPKMNKDKLYLGLISLDTYTDDPLKCREIIEQYLIEDGKELDLIVLPELFNSGFISDPEKLEDGVRLSRSILEDLERLANSYEVYIAGSCLWKEGGAYYNRGFIVSPAGKLSCYDKRHLFCKSPESKLMRKGVKFPDIVDIAGWKVKLLICYDLRFPVWCRQSKNEEARYDLLIVVANWPEVREYTWTHLLIARAIENQAFVAGVNRTGEDQYGTYDSRMTSVFDPLGRLVKNSEAQTFIKVELSKSEIEKQRAHWPLSNDADDFSIEM